jgi:hypothetical protein
VNSEGEWHGDNAVVGKLCDILIPLQYSLRQYTFYEKFSVVSIHCYCIQVYRNEGPWPIRDGTRSLAYYRLNTRKDIFQGVAGVSVT